MTCPASWSPPEVEGAEPTIASGRRGWTGSPRLVGAGDTAVLVGLTLLAVTTGTLGVGGALATARLWGRWGPVFSFLVLVGGPFLGLGLLACWLWGSEGGRPVVAAHGRRLRPLVAWAWPRGPQARIGRDAAAHRAGGRATRPALRAVVRWARRQHRALGAGALGLGLLATLPAVPTRSPGGVLLGTLVLLASCIPFILAALEAHTMRQDCRALARWLQTDRPAPLEVSGWITSPMLGAAAAHAVRAGAEEAPYVRRTACLDALRRALATAEAERTRGSGAPAAPPLTPGEVGDLTAALAVGSLVALARRHGWASPVLLLHWNRWVQAEPSTAGALLRDLWPELPAHLRTRYAPALLAHPQSDTRLAAVAALGRRS